MAKDRSNKNLKSYSDAELAAGLILPQKASSGETAIARAELTSILRERRKNLTSSEKLKGRLLQLKFIMEDYLNNSSFDSNKRFGYFLKAYMRSLNLKNSELAEELNIRRAVLSQYVNDHRKPPENIFIRLELHSHKTIPAADWYQIILKENLHTFKTNTILRKKESRHVTVATIED